MSKNLSIALRTHRVLMQLKDQISRKELALEIALDKLNKFERVEFDIEIGVMPRKYTRKSHYVNDNMEL